MLQSSANMRRFVDSIIAGVVGFLWVMLALAFLVALFGIVNTIAMNVLEQTRELALLRAVAMTRRQMRRMIVCQAAMIGLIGLMPGTLAGAALAYWLNTGSLPTMGRSVKFDLYPHLLLATVAAALGMVLAAALIPAARAARLNIIAALKQDG